MPWPIRNRCPARAGRASGWAMRILHALWWSLGRDMPNRGSHRAGSVWADAAYPSQANEAWQARIGRVSRNHRKKPPGRPMPRHVARANPGYLTSGGCMERKCVVQVRKTISYCP